MFTVKSFSGLFSQDFFLSEFSIRCEQLVLKKFCFPAFLVASLCLLSSYSFFISIHIRKELKSELSFIKSLMIFGIKQIIQDLFLYHGFN